MNKQIINIEKIKPINKNEIIILTFDPNQIPMNDMQDLYNDIKSCFPDNKIFGFIKGIKLEIDTWQEVYDYLMSIKPQKENDNGDR